MIVNRHTLWGDHITRIYHIIWTFINALKREHALVHMAIMQQQAGLPPPARKRKYVDVDNRITAIVADYANQQPIDFLRAISYNDL